ncbi:DNA methyltransferase [Flavobacterium phage vB_FspS_tooticki9-1]|uniref:DNA methyltransferase n=10 Tax=Muminvirus TaxID=2843426 RepID=A0A6B9LPE1_9CAUD|nr:DNA methyltransferase [Flavobacterium phage vB_FspS_filifjonk9-1]YP_009855007.1 DNA methyltransferase [Flavobacterium phage vB_FspS_mumin9-1]YP_009855491.1 DNA methyltransferase [Flavobacterium phage vB_FspS_tooticki6-1]QHB39613.1 DNA methyltransferase [Flavobacterium phage vB_FspS_mumin6-1]QHB39680.1 DNA methyltransferase [Flavobacterium phage vB_FspS_mumin6-2]QHB39747.1 DNA methyltransferase [Flavobacterium phage vB_FspS_mumin6-3]QHB39813.1 DNA methyltransferase [Flavobacterium phage vB_
MIDRITEQPFCQTRVSGSTFVNADCFDVFPFIGDKSIDAIICDLPYGTTACKWDSILPFDKIWKEYERIIKPNGAIVLFGSQPFTSALVMSNPKMFKYEWIWKKTRYSGNLNATRMPLKAHENILVFAKGKAPYYPIKTDAPEHLIDKRKNVNPSIVKDGGAYNGSKGFVNIRKKDDGTRYPTTVQEFKNPNNNSLHPTQKPLELLEYLVKTYTNEGDTVLDNTMGSGTTNLACIKLNRKSIGIEKEKQYYDVAVRRALEYCH